MNDWDRALLRKHLDFYRSLDNGSRAPTTNAQHHFVAVCRGSASPRTQHEIAYQRYRKHRGESSVALRKPWLRPAPEISEEIETAIDQIDEAILRSSPESADSSFLALLRERLQAGREQFGKALADATILLTTGLSEREFAREMARWTGERFNTLSNDVTKAMDGAFAEGLRSGSDYVSPLLHRLYGGHTIPEALEAAKAAMPNATDAEQAWQASMALLSDLSSVAGLPIATFTPEGYATLEHIAGKFGVSPDLVRDWATYDATELLTVVCAVPGALFSWDKSVQSDFSRVIGAMGVNAIVAANPIAAVAVIIFVAAEYQRTRQGSLNRIEWMKQLGRGGAQSGIILSASAVIGGPVILGLAVGFALSLAASRYADQDPSERRRLQERAKRAFFEALNQRRGWRRWFRHPVPAWGWMHR